MLQLSGYQKTQNFYGFTVPKKKKIYINKLTHPVVQEASNMSSDTQMALVPDRLNLAQLHRDHQPMPGTKIGNYILPKLHN